MHKIVDHSNLTILSSQPGCAKFSNLCQPFGPELTSLVIHYGRQRRDSFLNNISWGRHWGWWWRIINFSDTHPVTRVNWSISGDSQLTGLDQREFSWSFSQFQVGGESWRGGELRMAWEGEIGKPTAVIRNILPPHQKKVIIIQINPSSSPLIKKKGLVSFIFVSYIWC